jgi:acetyl esterase/lipase
MRIGGVVVLVVAASLLLAGCTPDDDRRIVEGAIEAAEDGPFYELPDPIPAGEPGELVRSEPIESTMDGSTAWRVLYHSTDVHGDDILVSGTVIAPSGAAPDAGRPVVAWGHPTTGAAPKCAPSLNIAPFDLVEGLRAMLDAGYVVAATDYPGMGAAGPDAYLVGASEGASMLDAARAARALPATGANSELLLWGHSQGGHAALFAAQMAPAYAPELTLNAVAVAAPATDLAALLDADIGDVSGVTISSYALDAYSRVYESQNATLDAILTPAGAKATPTMAAMCLFAQNSELHSIARPLIGGYFSGDVTAVEPWGSLLAQNSPGAAPIGVPVFIAQGEADKLVDPAVTRAYADRVCAAGERVTYLSLPGVGHGGAALKAVDSVLAWFGQVTRGEAVESDC